MHQIGPIYGIDELGNVVWPTESERWHGLENGRSVGNSAKFPNYNSVRLWSNAVMIPSSFSISLGGLFPG